MKRWLEEQFVDIEHARRLVLTLATVLGTVGFCMAMGAFD